MTQPYHNRAMQTLVGFRGSHEDIINELSKLLINRVEQPCLEPFEEPIKENDFGFNTNLGVVNGNYYDYEIYMLPTNQQNIWIITEINPF